MNEINWKSIRNRLGVLIGGVALIGAAFAIISQESSIRSKISVREKLESHEMFEIPTDTKIRLYGAFEKGDYKLINKEWKRFDDIKKNLNVLKSFIQSRERKKSIHLIITLKGELSKKFELIDSKTLKDMKSTLDSLRVELYEGE